MTRGTEPEIRPATQADIRAFHGGDLPYTARAWVADLDGEIIGVAGWYALNGAALVFSAMRPDMRQFRKVIVREARRIMSEIRGMPAICYASRDEPTSERFLQRLGWTWHHTAPEGEVYICRMP